MVPQVDKWIEIDADAVKSNLLAIKQLIPNEVRLIAVIKANAYGHGAAAVAHILECQGVDFFAVSFLREALELRKAGIKTNILLFAPVINEAEAVEAINNNITLTIASVYDSNLIAEVTAGMNRSVAVHLKLDTGLGRFGLRNDEINDVVNTLGHNPRIYLEGIYTHMARAAMANSSYTQKQFKEFTAVVQKLAEAGYDIPIKHCANSTAFLKYPQMQMNAVRIGTLLSGQYPAGIAVHPVELIDPYKFKSRVISVRTLKSGSYLGYYSTYRLKKDAQIAVIPVGFSDGLALEVFNKPAGFIDMLKIIAKIILGYLNMPRFNLHVIIKGKKYPVRGKVFMQMALVEIPPGENICPGDEVELPVKKTIAASNITRLYMSNGSTVKIGSEERTAYYTGEN